MLISTIPLRAVVCIQSALTFSAINQNASDISKRVKDGRIVSEVLHESKSEASSFSGLQRNRSLTFTFSLFSEVVDRF